MPDGVLVRVATLGRASDPSRYSDHGRHPERRSGSVHASHGKRCAWRTERGSSAPECARGVAHGKRLWLPRGLRDANGGRRREDAAPVSRPASPKTLLTPALDRLAFYFPHSGWRRAFCGGGPTWGRPHSGGFGGGLVVAADRMASVAFILHGLPVRAGATQKACVRQTGLRGIFLS